MINIDNLIKEAAKDRNPSLAVFRLIKAEFLKWQKDNPAKEFDAVVEAKILKKMYNQRLDSYKIYMDNNRNDLAEPEMNEAQVIKQFLPKETSKEEVAELVEHIIKSSFPHGVTMKDTKLILSKVQDSYPDASGKLVSSIVKEYASKS